MYYAVKVNEDNGGRTKEREYMIRKKRMSGCEFIIKPNLSKKSYGQIRYF